MYIQPNTLDNLTQEATQPFQGSSQLHLMCSLHILTSSNWNNFKITVSQEVVKNSSGINIIPIQNQIGIKAYQSKIT